MRVTVFLSEKLGLDFAKDVGEAEVATGVFVSELLVVESEEMEQGGVKVVHVKAT